MRLFIDGIPAEDYPHAEVSWGGIPIKEYNRLQKLSRRKLLPTDIPHEKWSDRLHGGLLLREDGAIVFEGDDLVAGTIRGDGTVDWVQG